MANLVGWNMRIDSSPDDVYDVRKEVEEWFTDYLRHVLIFFLVCLVKLVLMISDSERMRDYTETNLWDVWYTKNPDGITEVSQSYL